MQFRCNRLGMLLLFRAAVETWTVPCEDFALFQKSLGYPESSRTWGRLCSALAFSWVLQSRHLTDQAPDFPGALLYIANTRLLEMSEMKLKLCHLVWSYSTSDT